MYLYTLEVSVNSSSPSRGETNYIVTDPVINPPFWNRETLFSSFCALDIDVFRLRSKDKWVLLTPSDLKLEGNKDINV